MKYANERLRIWVSIHMEVFRYFDQISLQLVEPQIL